MADDSHILVPPDFAEFISAYIEMKTGRENDVAILIWPKGKGKNAVAVATVSMDEFEKRLKNMVKHLDDPSTTKVDLVVDRDGEEHTIQ